MNTRPPLFVTHLLVYCFSMLERARMAYAEEHGYGAGVFNLPKLYTDQLLNEAEAQLSQAAANAAIAPEFYCDRVAIVRAGLDFSRLLIDNIRVMESYWDNEDEGE